MMKQHLVEQQKSYFKEIKSDSYRLINLALFLIICISNSIPIHAFSAVSSIISNKYKVSILETNVNALSYFFLYMIMILPANYIIDYKGLKAGTLISQILMSIGLSLRCLMNVSLTYFLFGTFLCAFSFCLIFSAGNKFASIWFLEKQVFYVKSLIIFTLLISDAVGYFLSAFFISQSSNKEEILKFFLIESAIIISFQILNMIFFKGSPANPQNYSSQRKNLSYSASIASLITNKNYFLLFFSMTFIFIYLDGFFIKISQLETVFEISRDHWKICILIAMSCGLLGTLLNNLIFKQRYKVKCVIFLSMIFFWNCLIWLALEIHQQFLINLSIAFVGFCIFPFVSTLNDWALQCAFPVGQGTSGGSMFFGGHFFGTISTVLFSLYNKYDLSKQKSRIQIIMLLGVIFLSLCFLMFCEQDLRRKQYESLKLKKYKYLTQ